MSKLWLIGLAASAAWTPAIAQGAPPPMAHGAHAPAPMVSHGGRNHSMAPAMHGGGMKGMKGGGHMRGGGHIKGMKGWQRFGRGHTIPPHFRHRQYFVNNWHSFGWPAPMPGGQWIRHYDDALLIDRDGRVMDSRYGWDWDGRGGGHRAYDDGGYDDYGRDDYGRDDYGRDGYAGGDHGRGGYDRNYGRDDYAYEGGEDCRCGPAGPPPHPGYGSGYGYGSSYGYGSAYGYGHGYGSGPVVVTETITTTAPVMETHTYYETVTEHRSAPRRHYRKPAVRHYSKPVVRRSVKPAYRAPAPRPGERG